MVHHVWDDYEHLGSVPKWNKKQGRGNKISALGSAGSASTDVSALGDANVPAVAGKSSSFVQKWMIDSGCGHDLILGPEARKCPKGAHFQGAPMAFATANGRITTQDQVHISIEEFGQTAEPYVLPETPSV